MAEQPPPEVARIGSASRRIAELAMGQIIVAAGTRPWNEAYYSTKLNDDMTGVIHALWMTHPDGAKTPLRPADEIMPLVNVMYGVSGKLEKPFIGFSITMKPDGSCETDFLYPDSEQKG
jgi:hypothetical protein